MAAKIVIRVAVAVGLIAGLAFVARAETPPPPDEGGRYLLRKAQDGWFRIDQKTGQASVCALGPAGYVCELVPDDRDALLDEITRLAEENAMLRAQLARADLPPRDLPGEPSAPSTPDAPGADAGKNDDGSALPTEEDIDRMMGAFRLMVERFLAMVKDLQDQLSEPSGN